MDDAQPTELPVRGGPTPLQQPPSLPPVPQLPPQMFTTAAQLLDMTDKKLMIALRDGRKFIGVLRSWDQFGNLVLQDTIERIYAENVFADIDRGLFLVRGENVMLLGEIDLDREDVMPPGYTQVAPEQVLDAQKVGSESRRKKNQRRQAKLQAWGFEGEQGAEVIS